MNRRRSLLDALAYTEKLLNNIIFMCDNRAKSTFFTRNCKMGFKDIMLFAINLVKKSLQIELDLFFKNIKGGEPGITKQGFSEARQKILPRAFIQMFYNIIEWYYDDDSFKKFMGYRFLALDGFMVEINNSKRLREAYGFGTNGKVKVARALAMGIYDIENDIMVAAKIFHCNVGEKNAALELLSELIKRGPKNDLIIFDRGYPSTRLISFLQNNNLSYLMRVSKTYSKAIIKAIEPDQIIKIDVDSEPIEVRVIRFLLDSGEEEILITNLLDRTLSVADFKQIYFKRWRIETKYDELKNRLEIENFTGDTAITVEQDFYASMYLLNMAAIAKAEANETIQKSNQGKDLKHEYKVNTNILIGKLKDRLILMLLEDDPEKRTAMFRETMTELTKNVVPIRPGRNNVHKKGLKSNKYPLNRKRSL